MQTGPNGLLAPEYAHRLEPASCPHRGIPYEDPKGVNVYMLEL